MTAAEIEIRELDVARILDLRHRVLRAGLPPEAAHFDGDQLSATRHIAALTRGTVIGCATLLLNSWNGESAWQLRGMAVEEGYRSRGVGKQLLDTVEKLAADSQTQLLWCNARVPAVRFYEKAGWRVVSEQFDVPTAGPHVKMLKRLT